MKNVYIVTEGMYSDYSILAVFTSEADAQAHADRLNNDMLVSFGVSAAQVEEWPLYPAGKLPVLHVEYGLTVWLRANGSEQSRNDWTRTYYATPPLPTRQVDVEVFDHRLMGVCQLIARASTAALAEKAMQDRVAMLRAEIAGIT